MFKNGTGKLSKVRADNVKNFEVKSSRSNKIKPPKINIMVRGQRVTLGDVEVKGEKLSCNMCKRKGLNMKDGRCAHCTKETKKFKPKNVNPVEQRIREITPQYRKELGEAKNLKDLEKVKSGYHWRVFTSKDVEGNLDDLAYHYRDSKHRNGFRILSDMGNEYVDDSLRDQWRSIRTIGDLLNLRDDIDEFFGGIGILKETEYVIEIRNKVNEKIIKAREMKLNE